MAIGTALVFGAASPALAQAAAHLAPAEAASPAALDADVPQEIIVTAQRRSESLQKVPISVNAFNQDTLRNLNIRSTDQLQFATPGFVNTQTAGDGISAVYIRGVGTGYSGPGLEGSVATYVDDVYLQTQTSSAQTAIDVEQIQILKGPQGTLYGRNATGGAIVMTTVDPKLGRTEGYVKAGYGSLDWKRGEAVLNLPLGDTVAARVAGFYENRDGYVKNVAIPGLVKSGVGAGDTYSARLKLLWQPGDDFKMVAKVQYDRRNGNGAVHSLRYTAAGAPTGLGYYQTMQSPNREGGGGDDSSALEGSLHAEYTTGTWTVSNTAAFRRARSYGCTDNDGVPAENAYFCLVSQRSPNPNGAHGKEDKTFTNEFRVVSNNDGPFDVTAGLFFERNRARFSGRVNAGALLPTFDNRDNLTAYSGFLEGYYKLTDRVKLTGGLRYTHERKYHSVLLDADALALVANSLPAFDDAHKNFSNVSPRVVLSYDAGSINYYASYNRGFKSGGYNSPDFTVSTPLKPEKIDAFEVGAKFKSSDGRLRLNSAAYWYNWKDVQVAFIQAQTIFQQNAAAARIYGGELSLDWTPNRAWQVNLGAAYTHGRFRDFPSAAVYNLIGGTLTPAAADLGGVRLPQSPDFTGNANVTYNFDLPADWSGNVTVSGRYSSSYDFTAGAAGQLRASRQKAFSLVNLTGSFLTPGKNIELGWFVSNLFKQHYISLISTSAIGVYETPAEPRIYGVTARYSF